MSSWPMRMHRVCRPLIYTCACCARSERAREREAQREAKMDVSPHERDTRRVVLGTDTRRRFTVVPRSAKVGIVKRQIFSGGAQKVKFLGEARKGPRTPHMSHNSQAGLEAAFGVFSPSPESHPAPLHFIIGDRGPHKAVRRISTCRFGLAHATR